MGHFSFLPNDSSCHLLFDPPLPAYTDVTIRRALIVWLQCGQQNEFRHVCNYFHRLESMEDKLSAEDRAASRTHEFNLLSNLPPVTHYLIEYFPKLYRHNKNDTINIKEIQEITVENCVFNLEGFHDMKIQKGAKTKDINKTSQMIRMYSKTHSKSLRILLGEFQDFAKKTEAANSVDNIAIYIQKLYLKDELLTWSNIPKSFNFLDDDEDTDQVDISESKTENLRDGTSPIFTVNHTFIANKNADNIEIFINESRRKELLNMIPNNYQNVQKNVAAKLTILQKQKPGSVFYADFARKM